MTRIQKYKCVNCGEYFIKEYDYPKFDSITDIEKKICVKCAYIIADSALRQKGRKTI